MDHFDIILALARAALETKNPRTTHHVQQLRDALAEADREQSRKLSRLLTAAKKKQEMTPLAFEEMRQAGVSVRHQLSGELLTRNTPLPHDKESGAPLIRVVFPDDPAGAPPVFPLSLSEAVDDLLKEWTRLDRLAKLQASPHLRCLLYGAPGVGKTQLAHYIARHLDLPCVEARLDGLVSSFLGTTARNIGMLFDFANRYRCVLFLDEFDALAKARDDAHELGEIKRVVNTLLQCLDAREGRGFTIAATNHEHLLDEAVWRRFEARINVPRPDANARRQILRQNLSPLTLDATGQSFLEWLSDGLTGADIASIAQSLKRYLAVHGEQKSGLKMSSALLVAALRRFVVLNAKLFSEEKIDAISGDREELDKVLVQAGLNQSERAKILGVSQSTISRSARPKANRSRKTAVNG